MYLKRKLCIVENELSFEIGSISVMRACVIKRVRPILYGTPCNCHWHLYVVFSVFFTIFLALFMKQLVSLATFAALVAIFVPYLQLLLCYK